MELREEIAEYIYNQEMDSRYQNFFSWEQAKSENDLKSMVNDYYKQADFILSHVRQYLEGEVNKIPEDYMGRIRPGEMRTIISGVK